MSTATFSVIEAEGAARPVPWLRWKSSPSEWKERPMRRLHLTTIFLIAVLSWTGALVAEPSGRDVIRDAVPTHDDSAMEALLTTPFAGKFEAQIDELVGPSRQTVREAAPASVVNSSLGQRANEYRSEIFYHFPVARD